MTSTVDSVIPLAGAADPTAFVNSATPAARSGISFADICAAQLSLSPETQSAAPAQALPSNPPAQTGNTTAPAKTPTAKGSAKNPPPAGSGPALAFLVALPPIPIAIPVSALPSAPPQMIENPSSGDFASQAGWASDGKVQSTDLLPASGITTAPVLAPGNTNASQTGWASDGKVQSTDLPPVSGITTAPVLAPGNTHLPRTATPIPGFPPAVDSSPVASASASVSASASDSWFLSSPVETNSAPSSVSSGSPSAPPPDGSGAQSSAVVNSPTVAPEGQAPPEIVSATRETFGLNATMPSQAPVATIASENPSFSPDAPPPLTLGNGDQASPNQPSRRASLSCCRGDALATSRVSRKREPSCCKLILSTGANCTRGSESATPIRDAAAVAGNLELFIVAWDIPREFRSNSNESRVSRRAPGNAVCSFRCKTAGSGSRNVKQRSRHTGRGEHTNGKAANDVNCGKQLRRSCEKQPDRSPAWECAGRHSGRSGSGDQRGCAIAE